MIPGDAPDARSLFGDFVDTIRRATSGIRQLSDQDLLGELFEEFDIEVTSFLYPPYIALLHSAGYISELVARQSLEVRELWQQLSRGNCTAAQIRVDPVWDKLFQLCDDILAELAHGTDRR